MQNPFRHRPQDDFAHQRDGDERQTRYASAEPRSWRDGRHEADGGPSHSISQSQGHEAHWERGMSDDVNRDGLGPRRASGRSQAHQRYFGGDWGDGVDHHRGGDYDRDSGGQSDHRYARSEHSQARSSWRDHQDEDTSWATRSGRWDASHGDRAPSQYERGFAGEGHAPGRQIWKDRDTGASGRHDFEPDYLHWRDQQLKAFDNDYSAWRSERRQKFSSDFESWRSSRPKGVQTEAANPYVGDVSEGGTAEGNKLDDNKTGKARN